MVNLSRSEFWCMRELPDTQEATSLPVEDNTGAEKTITLSCLAVENPSVGQNQFYLQARKSPVKNKITAA